MKARRLTAIAVRTVGGMSALHVAPGREQGRERTELQRHDQTVPGRDVIRIHVELEPAVY
jgi:hypothetical protein